MATKVLTTLQDDIDGSAATETVHFALDGVEWEIDLSERNANRLRNNLSVFIQHGRKVGGKKRRAADQPITWTPRQCGSGLRRMALTSIPAVASRLK